MSKITIKFVGDASTAKYPRSVAESMQIARFFAPQNSYVDSEAYVNGNTTTFTFSPDILTGDTLGSVDTAHKARSIYATNVDGLGFLPGLFPTYSTTARLAVWDLAIKAAKDAEAAGTANNGITFDIGSDYQEELYWRQVAQFMIEANFYTKFEAADNSPIMITGLPNVYGQGESFTITWKNYDDSVLATTTAIEDTVPVYSGDEPTKPEDASYTYTFDGWTPEVAAAVADATYTATFESHQKG